MKIKQVVWWMAAWVLVFRAVGSIYGEPDLAPATIAVVRDGSCAYFDRLSQRIQEEIITLTGDRFDVQFKLYDAQFNPTAIQESYEAAFTDPEVKLILAAGILSSRWAADAAHPLPKPVVTGFTEDPDSIGMPYNEAGFSTKTNYTFVVVPLRSARDLEVFREIAPFKKLTVLADTLLLKNVPEIGGTIAQYEKDTGVKVRVVGMDIKAGQSLVELNKEDEAIYLTPPMRMSPAEYAKLIKGINKKKIPSFSMMGHVDVELGALAGLAPDITERLARRVALNIQQVLEGASPNELQVRMPVDERLMLNAQTAQEIGLALPYSLMMQAELLHADALQRGAKLTMADSILRAVENNLELKVGQDDVLLARADRDLALTPLLPQLNGQVQYAQIDQDRAEASSGMQAEKSSTAGISISQIVFSDPYWARWRAAGRSYNSKNYEQDALRMDIAQKAAAAYVQYLSTRALLRIEGNNLKLTQDYLEMARTRFAAGTAGPEEIYRWESELASAKSSAIAAEKNMNVALTALNLAMNDDLGAQWTPVDIQAGVEEALFAGVPLGQMISNDDRFKALILYCLALAVTEAPELKALDESLQAQEILLAQYRRRTFVPDLGVSFDYDHTMQETIIGQTLSEQLAQAGMPVQPGPEADKDDWTLGLRATWSLFDGGGQWVDIARQKTEIMRVRDLRSQTAQLIQQRVLNALFATGSSFPNIGLTQKAADMARKNLQVVQEKYAQGTVSILSLLDAQNQAFVRDQNAALANYTFLNDLVDVQRSISWFDALKNTGEREAWVRGLKQAMGEN